MKGGIRNLKVKATETGLSVIGSLAKYHLGNNFETLTRQETERALERLSDELGLPMAQAKPFRLEVGSNFIVKQAVKRYCDALADTRYFERVAYRHGILYKN